ncbi:flagellar biosynthesis repressor FlbT [Hyphomicrobium nitrativorans NL23]|uniref:Flagellar biosynthesis repressor FlbT n=1 Tax=Hyphomicrobium nitrativorans NL23 TaxID=1029756 RepID=V5SAR0_9HYPH|nr:flagellar biosynthesis repressor FlbT [Hyphomicrobium nitrativorans]AHB47748.1 flagellar biosynthesis repressor FlbT [Hyphomicrobium nitrativorans NL23]
MSVATRVTLRPGERVFINGAVLAWDGRGSFDILNDVPYLLEHEILHAQQTVTPLRQLYYILQTMVLEPDGMETTREIFTQTMDALSGAFSNAEILAGLAAIRWQVAEGAVFPALKMLRTLVPIEDQILGRNKHAELRIVEAG